MSQHTIGELLSYSRQTLRASLYQAAQDTKIRVDFLEAMENDDFGFVSGGPYVRGMLRSYIRWLGLPESRVLHEYDRIYGPRTVTPVAKMITRPGDVAPKTRKPQWLLAALSAAGLLLVFSLIGLMNPSGEDIVVPEAPDTLVAQEPEVTVSEPPSDVLATPAADAAAPQPSTAPPASDRVTVTVRVVGEKAWMEATSGDEQTPVFTGTKFAGDTVTLEAEETLNLVVGDAGAVRLNVNGRDLGPPGRDRDVVNLKFTPESTTLAEG